MKLFSNLREIYVLMSVVVVQFLFAILRLLYLNQEDMTLRHKAQFVHQVPHKYLDLHKFVNARQFLHRMSLGIPRASKVSNLYYLVALEQLDMAACCTYHISIGDLQYGIINITYLIENKKHHTLDGWTMGKRFNALAYFFCNRHISIRIEHLSSSAYCSQRQL